MEEGTAPDMPVCLSGSGYIPFPDIGHFSAYVDSRREGVVAFTPF
jgi:hypothetical protein